MDGARDAKGRFRGLSGRLRTRSECLVSAVPASKALHAALRTNVLEGLGAVIRRVSHGRQLEPKKADRSPHPHRPARSALIRSQPQS